jgi:hypothetical protein
MPPVKEPEQLSLFPTRNSLDEVEQEALAALPITSPNQILAMLRLYGNTLERQLEKVKK